MSSPGSTASRHHLPVTLLDQAEAAVDIVQSFNKRKPPIKVTPNGSAAVGLLVRKYSLAQPEAFELASALGLKLLLSSREERSTARTALEKRLGATVENDKRIAFESRYDKWQYIVLQLKPKWLDGTTTVAKTDRVEIRRPAPTSLLLYLLYDVVAAVERLPDGPEPLHCALSVLYVFSLLVLPRQKAASDRKHVELKFSHSSWRDTFDRHLRTDDAHRERYKKVRALLRDETLKAGEELHDWASWLVESTDHALRDEEDDKERTVDERVDVVVEQMTAFLQKVYRMIIGPYEPGARSSPSPVAPGRPRLVRRRGGGQVQCATQ